MWDIYVSSEAKWLFLLLLSYVNRAVLPQESINTIDKILCRIMNTKQSGLLLLKTCQDTHKAGTHRRLSISRSRCSSPLLQGCGRACFSCASVWKSHQGTRGVRVCQWMSRRMARHVQRALLHARTHPARPYTRIAHAHADTRIHTQTPMRAHTHTHTHTHARMYACAHKQAPPPPPVRAR